MMADSNIIGDDSCYHNYTLLNSSKDSIRFVCNGKIRKTEFTIYNRKGERLFHATDTATYWKYNMTVSKEPHTPMYPSGVYYYMATWKEGRRNKRQTGSFSLLQRRIEH